MFLTMIVKLHEEERGQVTDMAAILQSHFQLSMTYVLIKPMQLDLVEYK